MNSKSYDILYTVYIAASSKLNFGPQNETFFHKQDSKEVSKHKFLSTGQLGAGWAHCRTQGVSLKEITS
jgi:hypothetical protein